MGIEGIDLSHRELNHDELSRLTTEVRRLYPQLGTFDLGPAWSVLFYPGYVLLHIEQRNPDAKHLALCNPVTGAIHLLDAEGSAMDLLDRVAPLTLEDWKIAQQYLQVRMTFVRDLERQRRFSLQHLRYTHRGAANANYVFSAQLIDEVKDRAPRKTNIELHLTRSEGIVFARTTSSWSRCSLATGTAEQSQTTVQKPKPKTARVTTPPFIDQWQETWKPATEESKPGGNNSDAAASNTHPSPYRELLDGFGIGQEQWQRTLIRSTSLPFYRNFRLFEVIVTSDNSTVPTWGYCLGRPRSEPPSQWQFLWLDGTTPPIHEANKQLVGEYPEILLDDASVGDALIGTPRDPIAFYLRFYCWAMGGPEGSFHLPPKLDRLEFKSAPNREALTQIEPGATQHYMLRLTREEIRAEGAAEEGFFRKALVIYGTAAFLANFRVSANGTVDMTSDKPIADRNSFPVDAERSRPVGGLRWQQQNSSKPEADSASEGASDTQGSPPPADYCKDGHFVFENHTFDAAGPDWSRTAHAATVRFRNCRFEGGCCWNDRELPGLEFHDCIIAPVPKSRAAVDLTDAKIRGGLHFVNCHIRGDLLAANVHVAKDLIIHDCFVTETLPDARQRAVPELIHTGRLSSVLNATWQAPYPTAFDVDLSRSTVVGQARVGNRYAYGGTRTVLGGLRLGRIKVDQDLRLQALLCTAGIDAPEMKIDYVCSFGPNLEAANINGMGLGCESLYFLNVRVSGHPGIPTHGISLRQSQIRSDINFNTALIEGDLSLYAARIGGNINFVETRFSGDIYAAFVDIGQFFCASSRKRLAARSYLECKGAVTFSGGSVGTIELSGVVIEGALNFVTGHCSSLYLYPAFVIKEGRMDIAHNRIGEIVISNVEIEDDLRMRALSVGSASLDLFERFAHWFDDTTATGIRIENSHIHGSFQTFPPELTSAESMRANHKFLIDNDSAAREIIDEMALPTDGRRATIRKEIFGDLYMRGNRIDGTMELRDVTIFGRLVLSDCELGLDLRIDSRRPLRKGTELGLRTRCTGADLEKIVCKGDVDLTGLSTQKLVHSEVTGAGHQRENGSGDLKLRNALVQGDLLLARRPEFAEDSLNDPDDLCRIEGNLDLSAIQVNRLRLTGANIQNASANVSLERAKLSRLEIVRPTPEKIDLTAIEVARWSGFEDHKHDEVGHYVEILSRMEPIDLGVWVKVESQFRNVGRDAEANTLYRKMRRQLRKEMRRKWSNRVSRATIARQLAFDCISNFTTSYGTRPWMPLLCLLPFSIVLAVLLSDAANVEPTADMIQAQSVSCDQMLERGKPDLVAEQRLTFKLLSLSSQRAPCALLTPQTLGYSWNGADGTYLAIRQSIPVIQLFTHEDWKPAHRPVNLPRWLHCSVDSHACLPPPPYVDTFAAFVSLLGWIAVPIWLLFAGTKVIRGRT